jgi:hypothetical protein
MRVGYPVHMIRSRLDRRLSPCTNLLVRLRRKGAATERVLGSVGCLVCISSQRASYVGAQRIENGCDDASRNASPHHLKITKACSTLLVKLTSIVVGVQSTYGTNVPEQRR